ASQATTSPIDVAGMDMKPTAARTDELFLADLRAFVGASQSPLVDRIVTTYGLMRAPGQKDLQDFQKAVDDLLAAIRSHRATFEQAHGAMEIAFFEHALADLRGDGTSTYHRRRADR